jgi:iron complex outermembrane receptor protein
VRAALLPLFILSIAVLARTAQAGEPPATNLPAVTVVALAPGVTDQVQARRLSHSVQTLEGDALDHAQGGSIADALDRGVAGIGLSAVQGNPWQPDLQYRGFVASPVLGTPQGIAVYQDGVRLNEVFGDTVGWDLVPSRAIETATLDSSAALFGQNALGGSITLRGKTGFSAPGTRLGYEGGSWGRNGYFLESGGNDGVLGYYLLTDHLSETGWRDASPSHLQHQTAVVSYRQPATTVDLHLAHADTDLTGNGASPIELLEQRRQAIFTAPDDTQSRLSQASLSASHRWSDETILSGTVYSRRVRVASFNGDVSEYASCLDAPDMLCDASGSPLRSTGGVASSNYDAIANEGLRHQEATGGNLSFRTVTTIAGVENRWLAGSEFRRGSLDYVASQRLGTLDDQRYVAASGPLVDSAAVAVGSHTQDDAFYLSDQVRLGGAWTLDVSSRFNRSTVTIADHSGDNPALDGHHAFDRLNPSVGLAWGMTEHSSTYVSYAETTRVPTPVELTCADPDAPCRLPNDFISDPPLKQVVARSVEWGARGAHGDTAWHAALFRTTSSHDIVFQTTGGATSNQGFFANVGDTRREGVEGSAQGRLGRFHWQGNYTFLRAVYLTDFDEVAANHPDADEDGILHVRRGDRLPGLPRHNLRFGVDWSPTDDFALGMDSRYVSGQYLRGDESNQLAPTAGYLLFDGHGTWRSSPRLEWTLQVDNIFNRRYASFGTLGEADEVFPDMHDARFFGPGSPRSANLSVQLQL